MNKNKRIVFGIVGGSLYMLGFIVDDTDILVQLISNYNIDIFHYLFSCDKCRNLNRGIDNR